VLLLVEMYQPDVTEACDAFFAADDLSRVYHLLQGLKLGYI